MAREGLAPFASHVYLASPRLLAGGRGGAGRSSLLPATQPVTATACHCVQSAPAPSAAPPPHCAVARLSLRDSDKTTYLARVLLCSYVVSSESRRSHTRVTRVACRPGQRGHAARAGGARGRGGAEALPGTPLQACSQHTGQRDTLIGWPPQCRALIGRGARSRLAGTQRAGCLPSDRQCSGYLVKYVFKKKKKKKCETFY